MIPIRTIFSTYDHQPPSTMKPFVAKCLTFHAGIDISVPQTQCNFVSVRIRFNQDYMPLQQERNTNVVNGCRPIYGDCNLALHPAQLQIT